MLAPDQVPADALPVVLTIAGFLWALVIAKGWWRT